MCPISSTISSGIRWSLSTLGVEAAVASGVGEQRGPFCDGAEGDAVAGQAGADPDGDCEVGLAGAGRS
jgi:hypothetical protein